MAKLTKRELEIIKETRIESLEKMLGLLETVETLSSLENLKIAIRMAILACKDAGTKEEATKNVKDMFGIEL